MSGMYELYKMSEGIMQIDEMLSHDEVDKESYDDMMESFELIIKDESEGIIKYTRNLSSGIDAISNEIERLSSMKKDIEKKKSKLMDNMKEFMEKSNLKKIETPIGSFQIRNNPGKVEIEDITKIPSKFFTIKQTEVLDKNSIKQELKLGNRVLGASLVKGTSISIK